MVWRGGAWPAPQELLPERQTGGASRGGASPRLPLQHPPPGATGAGRCPAVLPPPALGGRAAPTLVSSWRVPSTARKMPAFTGMARAMAAAKPRNRPRYPSTATDWRKQSRVLRYCGLLRESPCGRV